MNRRGFVSGLLAMPAIIRTPGLLMAIKPVAPWILRNQSPAEWLDDMIRESVQRPQRLRGWVACSLFDDTGYAPWPDGTWLRQSEFGIRSGSEFYSLEDVGLTLKDGD